MSFDTGWEENGNRRGFKDRQIAYEIREDGIHFDIHEDLHMMHAKLLSSSLRRELIDTMKTWKEAPKLGQKLYVYKQDGEHIRVSTIGKYNPDSKEGPCKIGADEDEQDLYAKIRVDVNARLFTITVYHDVLHPRIAWSVGLSLVRLFNYVQEEYADDSKA